MDFLKEILGEELYSQVEAKINEYNGDEEPKVKLANLAAGEYVGKGKYEGLQTQLNSKQSELDTANALIEDLKNSAEGSEALKDKITTYESDIQKLQAQLVQAKIEAAIKVGFMQERVKDVDYMAFKLNEKLKEKGETLELDENDNIKGWDENISGLRVSFPHMFDGEEGGDGYKPIDGKGLPNPKKDKTITKEQFKGMTYEERLQLKQDNEKLYEQLAK